MFLDIDFSDSPKVEMFDRYHLSQSFPILLVRFPQNHHLQVYIPDSLSEKENKNLDFHSNISKFLLPTLYLFSYLIFDQIGKEVNYLFLYTPPPLNSRYPLSLKICSC